MKKPTAPASAYNTKPSTDCKRERPEAQPRRVRQGHRGPGHRLGRGRGDMRPGLLRALRSSRLLQEPRGRGGLCHTNLQSNEDSAGADGKGEHGDYHTHHQI